MICLFNALFIYHSLFVVWRDLSKDSIYQS